MAARKPLIAATLVVFCLLSLLCASPVLALSVEEVTGLQSFATLFPSLSSIPEVETFSDEGVFLGSSWDESMPNACDAGDGWRLHGIHCSEGQIDEIYISQAFHDTGITGYLNTTLSHFPYLQKLTIGRDLDIGKPLLDSLVYGYASLPTSLKKFSWNTRRIPSVTPEAYPQGDIPTMINWMLTNLQIQNLHLGPALTEFTESATTKFQWSTSSNLQILSIPYYPAADGSAFANLDGLQSAVISIINPTNLYTYLYSVQELTIVPVSDVYPVDAAHWTPFRIPRSVLDLSIALPTTADLVANVSSEEATFRFDSSDLNGALTNLQVIWNSENFTFQQSNGLGFSIDFDVTGSLDLDLSNWVPADETVFSGWHWNSSFPANVKYFTLHTPTTNWSLPDAFYQATGLLTADFYGHPLSSFGSDSGAITSLQRLTFNDYPESETGFSAAGFEDLACTYLPLYTSLNELRLHNVALDWSNSVFQGCFDLPNYAALTIFELRTPSPFRGVQPFNLPAHVVDFTFVYTNTDIQQCELDLFAVSYKFGSYLPSPLRRLTISGITDTSGNWILVVGNAFSDLEYLDLSYNSITGTLPDTWFSSFDNLSYLDLSQNGLSGSIPTMSLKANLEHLNLSYNFFNDWALTASSGDPDVTGARYALKVLDVSFNKLTTIPSDDAFVLMNSLVSVDLSSNNLALRGQQLPRALPIFWLASDLPALRTVNLSRSVFDGALAGGFYPNSGITVLDLSNNQLTGSIPEVEGDDLYLEILDVSNNLITTIPATFSALHINQELNIASNAFNAAFSAPGKPTGWPALEDFVSSPQQLFGGNVAVSSARASLPKYALGGSSSLRKLAINMGTNTFTGGLPISIAFASPVLPAETLDYRLGFLNMVGSGIDYCATNFTDSYSVPAKVVCEADLSICACRSQLINLCDWDLLDPICAEAFPAVPFEPVAPFSEPVDVEEPTNSPVTPEPTSLPLDPLATPTDTPVDVEPTASVPITVPVDEVPVDEPITVLEPSPSPIAPEPVDLPLDPVASPITPPTAEVPIDSPIMPPTAEEPINAPVASEPVDLPVAPIASPTTPPVEIEPISEPVDSPVDRVPTAEPITPPVESVPVDLPTEPVDLPIAPITPPVEIEPISEPVDSPVDVVPIAEPITNPPVESAPVDLPVEPITPTSTPVDIEPTFIPVDAPVDLPPPTELPSNPPTELPPPVEVDPPVDDGVPIDEVPPVDEQTPTAEPAPVATPTEEPTAACGQNGEGVLCGGV